MTTTENLRIPSSYSRIVAAELGLRKRDIPRLLANTGLNRDILLPGDETMITGSQQLQILDNSLSMTATPEFGLRLGQRLQPSSHGPLGFLALSSPDLLTSLQSLRDFLPVRLPFVQLKVVVVGQWINCSLAILLPASDEVRRMMQECFACVIQSLAESVLGRPLTEGVIELAHSQPPHHRIYPQYLHAPVRFGVPENTFRLSTALAREVNAASDARAYALAQALCRELLQQVPKADLAVSDRVKHLMLSRATGTLKETEVAEAMFMSKRTLARRLDQEGTSYRAIREKLLSEMAARHLRESDLSVESVATLLAYNDAAAFRKAFARWYGQSPGAFRKNTVIPSGHG